MQYVLLGTNEVSCPLYPICRFDVDQKKMRKTVSLQEALEPHYIH
jgi:hypothetical protein